jgi:hypothetical protein
MGQVGHLVVGSTKLEAENGKHILPLKKHSTLHTVTEVDGMVKRGFGGDFVNTGGEDQPEILVIRDTLEGLRGTGSNRKEDRISHPGSHWEAKRRQGYPKRVGFPVPYTPPSLM